MLKICIQLLGRDGGPNTTPVQRVATPELKNFDDRELEFLRLTRNQECWPYTYIAVRMGLKLPTLHYLRRKLFEKLGVNSRTALALKVRDWTLG